jgi:mRNA-degrading endonuclease RelE of RelBE toxin-antitoxin system
MTYTVEISKEAENEIASLDTEGRAEVDALLEAFEVDPAVPRHSQAMGILQATTASGWRVFYRVNKKTKLVSLLGVGKEPRMVEPEKQTLQKPLRHLTREEAIRIVTAGIGGRPDLPPGAEYVNSIRHVWKSLVPRE